MNYTYDDICKKVKKLGFVRQRQAKGSHELWYHPKTFEHLIIPKHAGKTISKGVIKEIIKVTKLSNKAFQEL